MKKTLKYCFLLVISFLSFFSTIDGNSITPSFDENTPRPDCVDKGDCEIICSYVEGDNVLHIYYVYIPPVEGVSMSTGYRVYYNGIEDLMIEDTNYPAMPLGEDISNGGCPETVSVKPLPEDIAVGDDFYNYICFTSPIAAYCPDGMTKINKTYSLSEKIEEYGTNFKLKYNDYLLPADLSDVPEKLKTQLCTDYSASLTNANDGDNNYLDRLFIQQFGEEFSLKAFASNEPVFTNLWDSHSEMKTNLKNYMINLETNLIEECKKILPNDAGWNKAEEDLANKQQLDGYENIMNEAHREAAEEHDISTPKDPGYSVNVDTNVGTCQDYIGIVSVEGSPAYYIDYVYDVVKILVTVGLVLLSMFDIVKAITSEKNINSVYTKIAYRLVIVIMVLLLPTLISLVGELFTDKDILCGIR